jgi:hypothetical protein
MTGSAEVAASARKDMSRIIIEALTGEAVLIFFYFTPKKCTFKEYTHDTLRTLPDLDDLFSPA